MKIEKNMTIAEVLKLNPNTAKVFMSNGMHCIGCAIASGETVEQAAEVHGLDIKKLVDGLNAAESPK